MSGELETVSDIESLRERIRSWRSAGKRIGFVPTMGNLHQGHLALVREAQRKSERCVVSLFVNPMQFGAGEDYDSYPRTLEQDRAKLQDAGVELLFTPSVSAIYPVGEDQQTRVEVPGISHILCGASRPRHFVGVATIVCKLFNLVQPDLAVFGEKDYQQLIVIRRMVADLAIPVDILGLSTVREADGLAKSSRNGYLSADERALAPKLYETLRLTAEVLAAGDRDIEQLEAKGLEGLRTAGFRPDYFAIRRAHDLAPATRQDHALVILAAAYLGTTRLIDNLNAAEQHI
ncbi:MAG: pantoate--beta-alanine ligase [Candidatus Thiodiazotropha sp. (ex Dulcina madagascariensis)]|nr:pantoate--beta-alanine ligase [Candidatus Thiodiazotropha sp. (ex Dulcina madagascariensis)]